jgi:hypothetical protein
MKTIRTIWQLTSLIIAFVGGSALAITLPVKEDAFSTTQGKITPATGRAVALFLNSTEAALVKFDLSGLPPAIDAGAVVSARLVIYIIKSKAPGDLTVSLATSDWTEAVTVISAMPSFDTTPLGVVPAAKVLTRSFVTVDVTAAVIAALNGSGPNFGFILHDAAGQVSIASKEGPGQGPCVQLEIEANFGQSAFPGNITVGGGVTADSLSVANHIAAGTIGASTLATSGNLAVGGNISDTGSLNVGGPITGGSLSIAGNISAGSLAGGSLSVSGNINDTGSLSVGGSISGGALNGASLNVGGGSISGGALNGASLNVGVGSITSGSLSVGTIADSGNLSVNRSIVVDNRGLNAGSLGTDSLTFGLGSGEGIASKRTSGGNQFGLDFYTGGAARMNILNNGDVRVPGVVRQGSETGTTSGPGKGIVTRRLESLANNDSVVARTDGLILERDSTSGGFKINCVNNGTGYASVSAIGVSSSGTVVSAYIYGMSSGNLYQLFSDAQKVVYFQCSFGESQTPGHQTEVSLARAKDSVEKWTGSLISSYNQ